MWGQGQTGLMASKSKLWFHLESINSEMLEDYTCCGGVADNLQRMKEKKWTLLFLWNLLNTHTQSHLSKIKCFSCLVHFDLWLLWRFGSSWDFYLNMVPSNEVCQNEPGMSPSKNPTGMLCSSDIKVKINVSYPNQDAQS